MAKTVMIAAAGSRFGKGAGLESETRGPAVIGTTETETGVS
jgi:hypothetical protein